MSAPQEPSQTASDYIESQLRLEEDAREVLPYQFDTCTKSLGPIRQSVFACLTCTPPPATPLQQHTPAGICYSCSISCHGEHNLVELFTKRNFVCDCGTTRFENSGTPCTLRSNAATGRKDGVTGEAPASTNKYDQNYKGMFCGCGEVYDPALEKGTMFQCLGLGTVDEGGCGEDWWHPECLLGLPKRVAKKEVLDTVKEEPVDDDAPEGFPDEDTFDHFICYKCVNANLWIKAYAGQPGFLPGVVHASDTSKKRKAEEIEDAPEHKKARTDLEVAATTNTVDVKTQSTLAGPASIDDAPSTKVEGITALHETLPAPTNDEISLFLKEDFRNHFCKCETCFPRLAKHTQLLEEEEAYEPPLSESDQDEQQSIAGRSVNSGSLLDRGEAALSSMDRVRAIEGVMAYNHVRDKVKEFLAPFAASGQAVGAEDIKAYFAQLRGDQAT